MKFQLYWLDGQHNEVEGETIADAMNMAGFGQGSLRALDFYDKSDVQKNVWDTKNRKWVSIAGIEANLEDMKPSASNRYGNTL